MRLISLIIILCFATLGSAAHAEMLSSPVAAPEISTTGEWLNSSPLSSKDLKGKVVLVDFWTYSCINCLRTLPYIKSWYEAYKDKGFVVIGVHAPEFDFEKNKANVEKALKRFEITYPVVQDNDHLLWNRFSNQYWPAHYLINKQGQIVYTHFGEGNYDVTEATIRKLLDEKGGSAKAPDKQDGFTSNQTPETYLGSSRAERMKKPEPLTERQISQFLKIDEWMQTDWKQEGEYIESQKAGAKLYMHMRGGKVFLVMGTSGGENIPSATIAFNGKPVAGKDVKDGRVVVDEHRLYELIDLGKNDEGLFELTAKSAGLRAYAFTFGGY